jgi:hypothetical protein
MTVAALFVYKLGFCGCCAGLLKVVFRKPSRGMRINLAHLVLFFLAEAMRPAPDPWAACCRDAWAAIGNAFIRLSSQSPFAIFKALISKSCHHATTPPRCPLDEAAGDGRDKAEQ